MPDFRIVKNPKTLKGAPISADDEALSGGAESAIGLDTPDGQPDAQLNIRYRDGKTFVSLAVDDGKGNRLQEEHWRFAGHISPEDCRANWKAAQEAAAKLKAGKKADPAPGDKNAASETDFATS